MKYNLNQIKTAFDLAEIPQDFAERILNYLPEAVEKLRLSEPETLEDLFEQFCNEHQIEESQLKGKNRKHKLVELRYKFTKLAKEKFGKKATHCAIGRVLNKTHCTVLWYLNKYTLDKN